MTEQALERNLRLIPVHQALASAFVWLPIFVLFTRARFDLDGAILLASLYYLFVVVLEVPSGWMSDRFGRVLTLRIAALAWIAAHLFFLIGDDTFWAVVAGQGMMALGFASLSGTDVSFHYDTLEALDRAHLFARRQARVASIGFATTSVAVLSGGALGLVDLRVPFAVGAGLALVQLAVTTKLAEPPHAADQPVVREPQLRTSLRYLRSKPLAWLFLYGIAMVTLEHVAFSLLQPWLTEAFDFTANDLGSTPLISGLTLATTAAIGAVAARASAPLSERFGPTRTLIGFAVVSATIVSAMAAWTHPLVLALVALRNVQTAGAPVVIAATVAPLVRQRHRATFLSINSLAGRLGYGLILLALSSATDDDLTRVLAWLSVLSWGLVLAVSAAAPLLDAPGRTDSGRDQQPPRPDRSSNIAP